MSSVAALPSWFSPALPGDRHIGASPDIIMSRGMSKIGGDGVAFIFSVDDGLIMGMLQRRGVCQGRGSCSCGSWQGHAWLGDMHGALSAQHPAQLMQLQALLLCQRQGQCLEPLASLPIVSHTGEWFSLPPLHLSTGVLVPGITSLGVAWAVCAGKGSAAPWVGGVWEGRGSAVSSAFCLPLKLAFCPTALGLTFQKLPSIVGSAAECCCVHRLHCAFETPGCLDLRQTDRQNPCSPRCYRQPHGTVWLCWDFRS